MARETSHENFHRAADLNDSLIDAESMGAFEDDEQFRYTVMTALSVESELRGTGHYPPLGHDYPRR